MLVSSSRVEREVEEERRVGLGVDVFERALAQHDDRRDRAFCGIFGDHAAAGLGAARGERHEASAVERPGDVGDRAAGKLDQRRQHVEQAGGLGDAARLKARCADHQRHAGACLEEAHLEPEAALAEHVAVVGGEDDDGVLREPAGLQRLPGARRSSRRDRRSRRNKRGARRGRSVAVRRSAGNRRIPGCGANAGRAPRRDDTAGIGMSASR